MNILQHEQVLENEFRLLNENGPTLSQYYVCEPEQSSFFISPPEKIKDFVHQKYHVGKSSMKTCGNGVNAPFYIFACILHKIFFEGEKHLEMLDHLKCILYSPTLQIDRIKNAQPRQLSSNQMKKILVEFFQVMQYNNTTVEVLFNKYPIVLTLLHRIGIQNANDFNQNIETNKIINVLCDYFDLDYQIRKEIYIIQEAQFFIFVSDSQNQIMYGLYNEEEEETSMKHIFQDRFENEFNFNLGDSQNIENPELNPKDWNFTPTPCFAEVHEDQMNFHKKNHKEKLSSSKEKDIRIRETSEHEEDDEDSEEEKKLLYSVDLTKNKKNKELLKTDLLQNKDELKLKKETSNDSLQQNFKNQFEKAQSHIFNKNKTTTVKSKNLMKTGSDASFFSCLCSEARSQKNCLESNVIDVSFQPEKSRKEESPKKKFRLSNKEFSNSIRESRKPAKNTQKKYKMPEFLSKKSSGFQKQKVKTQPAQLESFHPSFEKIEKPKIFFTYTKKKDEQLRDGVIQSLKNQKTYKQPGKNAISSKTSLRELKEHLRMPSQYIKTFNDRGGQNNYKQGVFSHYQTPLWRYK